MKEKIKISDTNPWVTDLQPEGQVAWNGLDRGETVKRGGKGAAYEEWLGFGTVKLTDVRKR